MRKANEEVLAGKVPFRARERCWPIGVPGFVIYSLVEPFHFLQTPEKVTIINPAGPEVRQIFMNVPHSAQPRPSWYGESVGHYEGGDTLVIDTIGITDKTFVDNYRTPHTTKLHVVERLKLIEDGKAAQILITVVDPGAFTMPWSATQRWRRMARGPIAEVPCNENNADHFPHSDADGRQAGFLTNNHEKQGGEYNVRIEYRIEIPADLGDAGRICLHRRRAFAGPGRRDDRRNRAQFRPRQQHRLDPGPPDRR
jgi:hypothetical protein